MDERRIVYYSIVEKSDIKADNVIVKLETNQAITLLKKQLNYLDLKLPEICISANGKPYFKNSNLFFNYSHSKNYIACAVSFYEVGIDIEETTRNINNDVAKKYLDNVSGNKKRIETWVKKESYSKLKGLGLQMNLKEIKIDKIKEKNKLITNKDYICSIYSANDYARFKKIEIEKRNNTFWTKKTILFL